MIKARTIIETVLWVLVVILAFCLCLTIVKGQPAPPPVPDALILPEPRTVTLAWDPSPDSGVGAYKIYWGTQSGLYTMSTNMGTGTTGTVSGLTALETYWFAATAVGTNQLESVFTEEVEYTVPEEAIAPPSALGLHEVVVVRMQLFGAAGPEGPFTQLADIPVIVDTDKPKGFFKVETDVKTVKGVQW